MYPNRWVLLSNTFGKLPTIFSFLSYNKYLHVPSDWCHTGLRNTLLHSYFPIIIGNFVSPLLKTKQNKVIKPGVVKYWKITFGNLQCNVDRRVAVRAILVAFISNATSNRFVNQSNTNRKVSVLYFLKTDSIKNQSSEFPS